MATTTTKNLKMTFNVGVDGTKTLTLADPKDGLEVSDVQDFMGDVVDKQAIKVGDSAVSGAKSAQIVETTVTSLF